MTRRILAVISSRPQRLFLAKVKYTTDGKESTIQMRGREAKIKAVFKDGKLVVTSKSEINGAEIGQTETWTLSGDGKTLTIDNEVKAPQGDFKMKLLLTKGS